MNGIRVNPTGIRGVNQNEWEHILGRLDTVADEINRALGRVTSIEEPGSGVRITLTPRVVVSGRTLITDCGYRNGSQIEIL